MANQNSKGGYLFGLFVIPTNDCTQIKGETDPNIWKFRDI